MTLATVRDLSIGDSDLALEGAQILPNLAEHAAQLLEGNSDVPTSARNWSPALWAAVYSERSQSGRAVMPLLDAARDTSLYHPWHPEANGNAFPGLTATELNQLIAFDFACVASAGHKPLLSMPVEFFASRLDAASGEPCLDFVRQVSHTLTDTDWCAGFLGFGIMEAIPEAGSDWDPNDWDPEDFGAHDLTENPFSWVKKINPNIVEKVGPPGLPRYVASQDWDPADWDDSDFAAEPATDVTTGWGAMHRAFKVPKVLASFWRDRAGDLCLVLMNWTAAAANWQGRFSPWDVEGWGGSFDPADWAAADWDTWPLWSLERLDHGLFDWNANDWDPADWGGTPSATMIAASVSGQAYLCCSGTEGATDASGNLFLGPMPAYSIRAYRFRQVTT